MIKKTTYHHGDLRQALLKSALDILKAKDVQGLSLREVARQAGVSHTAPYRHFADKAALLAAVAEEGFVEFDQYLSAAVDKAQADPIESLKATGEAYVRYALEHPTHFRVMFAHFPTHLVPDDPLVVTAEGTFQLLVNIISSGQAAGVIKAGDPKLLATGRWALVHGLSMLLLDGMLLNPMAACSEGEPQANYRLHKESLPKEVLAQEGFSLPNEAIALTNSIIASSLTSLAIEGAMEGAIEGP
ncbi:MAG: TetR/AcrR family transcriptional regulator [Phormidesmis sp.]